jgi:hypothetical protein
MHVLRPQRCDPPTSRRPVIMSASIRIRRKSPTRCATMILLAHPDGRVHPHAAVSIPHRLSARPIAGRPRRDIDGRWRRVIARGGGCGPDNRSNGKSTYEPGAQVSAACTHWCHCGAGKHQRCHHRRKQKRFHLDPVNPKSSGVTVTPISNRDISEAATLAARFRVAPANLDHPHARPEHSPDGRQSLRQFDPVNELRLPFQN